MKSYEWMDISMKSFILMAMVYHLFLALLPFWAHQNQPVTSFQLKSMERNIKRVSCRSLRPYFSIQTTAILSYTHLYWQNEWNKILSRGEKPWFQICLQAIQPSPYQPGPTTVSWSLATVYATECYSHNRQITQPWSYRWCWKVLHWGQLRLKFNEMVICVLGHHCDFWF